MKFNVATLMAALPVAWARIASPQDVDEMVFDFHAATKEGSDTDINGCECLTDYDCHPTCIKEGPYSVGFCGSETPPTPTPPTTSSPFGGGEPCPCEEPKTIPSKCEVLILIEMMDVAVTSDHKRVAQWLRTSFHDAGTFDQNLSVGGANGCLMNHPPMLAQGENAFLDVPVAALEAIRHNWEAHPLTCIDISSADIMQFAGLFATVRQRGPIAGVLNSGKINQLMDFEWGRNDESSCDTAWTDNLPGFNTPASGGPIALRCTGAGAEIKKKMMDRNGFTALEATALIGAHTIGLTRFTFFGIPAPWVPNGKDNATPNGPVFDNSFHDFLINTIVANDAVTFGSSPLPSVAPFTSIFSDWFRDDDTDLNHLDTDVTLAFDSLDTTVHPHFRPHSLSLAASNANFLNIFDAAYEKMSKLGVLVPLSKPTDCDPCEEGTSGSGGSGGSGGIGDGLGGIIDVKDVITLISDLGTVTADAEDELNTEIKDRREELLDNTIQLDPSEIPKFEDPVQDPVKDPVPDPVKAPTKDPIRMPTDIVK